MSSIGAQRFAWVVVNVSDLERSRAFYETFTPLKVYGRIDAPEQRLGGIGIDRGSFKGYLLKDDSPGNPCAVQLVQWYQPAPTGSTYPVFTNPGYFRMCFQHGDVAGLYDSVVASGLEPLSPLRLPKGERVIGRPVFTVRDPDGAVIQFITFPASDRLYHTNCNTSHLASAHQWYEQMIGLRCFIHTTTTIPEDHAFGPGGDLATHDARLYRTPDGDADGPPIFALDVVESTFPKPTGHVYTEPTNVGIARVAIEVASVDAAYNWLLTYASDSLVGPPELWNLGDALGHVKTLIVRSPDGAPLELIERPRALNSGPGENRSLCS